MIALVTSEPASAAIAADAGSGKVLKLHEVWPISALIGQFD